MIYLVCFSSFYCSSHALNGITKLLVSKIDRDLNAETRKLTQTTLVHQERKCG